MLCRLYCTVLCSAGWTPLHAAAERGDAAIVSVLLDDGARVDAVTDTGYNPLHLAASGGTKTNSHYSQRIFPFPFCVKS